MIQIREDSTLKEDVQNHISCEVGCLFKMSLILMKLKTKGKCSNLYELIDAKKTLNVSSYQF